MKKSLNKIILTIVIILAFVLRFNDVTTIPPSLNWDEVAIGYNAYSILKTGKDEWGEFLPLHFKSYGEYKLPAQIYASIPAIIFFGLNELGVRITPIIYGTLTVIIIFFLGKLMFKSEIIGLISALLLAISPWHIQLTRGSFESSFSLFWILLGIWFFVKGFKDSKWFIISMIPFAFSVYTYNSARVFTPLFLFSILLLYRNFLFNYRKVVYTSLVIFLVLMTPLVPFLLKHGASRYKLVSITDEAGLIPRINENRGNTTLPQPLPILIHNKFTYITLYFTRNYLAHFTPNFLFISGAPHKQHHVQGMGQLYYFQLPFIFMGLFFLFRKKNLFKGLLLSWLFIAFIPVAVTNDSIPNALRTIIANPIYQLLTASGLYETYLLLRKGKYLLYLVLSATLIIGVLQFILYLNNYYILYPKLYSRDWQYGYKQVVNYIDIHKNLYDKVYITNSYGQPYLFTLFFMKYSPRSFQSDSNLIRVDTTNFIDVKQFDKFYFVDFRNPSNTYAVIKEKNKDNKVLFIGSAGDFPRDLPKLETINFLNGAVAFEIVDQ